MKSLRHAPALGLLLLAGCGDSGTNPVNATTSATSTGTSSTSGTGGGGTGGDASGGSGGAGGTADIAWTPCPLDSNASLGTDAECAVIPVPAKYDDLAAGTIDFFVKRKRATTLPSRGQVWFLNGGPGYSGADYEPLAQNIHDVDPTVDVYMPDHRGVGRSSRLSCPTEEAAGSEAGAQISVAEMPACLAYLEATWGAKLDGFSMTNAARDVGETIERTRFDSGFVIVDGGSYGSTLANRYMQIYPDQAAGVILDAVAITGPLSSLDAWFDDLGKRWLERCKTDVVCGAKMGADPWAKMTATLAALDGGACPEVAAMGFNRALMQILGASFFYDRTLRNLIAPMIYRLDRCAAEDVAAFASLAVAISGPPPTDNISGYFSLILSAHIVLSEMWAVPAPTVEDFAAFAATANVVHGLPAMFAAFDTPWPRYPLDEYAGKLATTSAHTLLLHGEYDFIPMSTVQPVIDNLAGPTSAFVLMPNAPHSTFQSPTTSGYASCGGHLLKLMLDDPTSVIDTTCVGEAVPLDMNPSVGLSQGVFGTSDAWDTPSSLQGSPGSKAKLAEETARSPELVRALTRVKHDLAVRGLAGRLGAH